MKHPHLNAIFYAQLVAFRYHKTLPTKYISLKIVQILKLRI